MKKKLCQLLSYQAHNILNLIWRCTYHTSLETLIMSERKDSLQKNQLGIMDNEYVEPGYCPSLFYVFPIDETIALIYCWFDQRL